MAGFGRSAFRESSQQRIIVGVGDMSVSNLKHSILSTYALGSCVGVVSYDRESLVAGMLHMMLPDSTIAQAEAEQHPLVFVDTAMERFHQALQSQGVCWASTRWVIAGGANVMAASDIFRIGEKNLEALKLKFLDFGWPIDHEFTGGLTNRTLHLDLTRGVLQVCLSNEVKEVVLS
jgi:chemotaxis protein CheD